MNPELHDKVAYRLLNCALWHMTSTPPRPAEAAAMILQVGQHCSNARTMATIAQHISSMLQGTEKDVWGNVQPLVPKGFLHCRPPHGKSRKMGKAQCT